VLLRESSRLAVRVAFSVLRQREDAEDVAQEAFAKAHRSFSQLRDRERFRAWLGRMTFRMALDRQRANRRRAQREFGTDDLAAEAVFRFTNELVLRDGQTAQFTAAPTGSAEK
jgi:RNA polymerase sigma-70 factor (ECF subfamily)